MNENTLKSGVKFCSLRFKLFWYIWKVELLHRMEANVDACSYIDWKTWKNGTFKSKAMMDSPWLWNPWAESTEVRNKRVPVAAQNGDLSPQILKNKVNFQQNFGKALISPTTFKNLPNIVLLHKLNDLKLVWMLPALKKYDNKITFVICLSNP